MAVVSRIATLVFSGATGSRTFQATAAIQDTAAGSSVVVTVTNSTTGVTPPVVPTTFNLIYKTDTGATIRTVSLNTSSASQTDTFYFSSTGIVSGASRCGTVEIVIQAISTTTGSTYNYTTDGTTTTAPTGFTATQVDRGWIRGTTNATSSFNQASYSYPDTISVTTTLGSAPFVARTIQVVMTGGGTKTSGSSSTTGFTTAMGTCDNTLPSLTLATRTTTTSFPNSSLTTLPWTTATLTEGSATTDPRLSVTHLLQKNDNSFHTPPLSANVASGQRLSSDLDFLNSHFTNASGTGQNGLTFNVTISDSAGLGQTDSAIGKVTANEGGQDGWGSTFLAWSKQLPSGSWTKTVTITAPGTATGLESGNTVTYQLVAANPNWRIVAAGGPALAANDSRHFTPGDPFLVGVAAIDMLSGQKLAIDTSPAPSVMVGRFNLTTGQPEYLDSDGVTWQPTVVGGVQQTIYFHALSASAGDSATYIKSFASTSGWGVTDIFIIGRCYVGGVPLNDYYKEIVTGSANSHDKYRFDPTGLFK